MVELPLVLLYSNVFSPVGSTLVDACHPKSPASGARDVEATHFSQQARPPHTFFLCNARGISAAKLSVFLSLSPPNPTSEFSNHVSLP